MDLFNSKIIWLALSHIFIICISNVLVQHPVSLLGFTTTWGAFTYPLIFVLTDLSVRILGPGVAKRVIFLALLPGLIGSLLISNYYNQHQLIAFNSVALRVALASLLAYFLGQLLDITVFQRLRQRAQWWVAPGVANFFGNLLDTFCFFFVAFYHSANGFLRMHWVEIAMVDLVFKMAIGLFTVIPLYGIVLQLITNPVKATVFKARKDS